MSLKLKLQRHFRFYTEIYSGNWDIEENRLQLASVPFVWRELFLIRRRSSIFRFWTLPKGALWPWHRIKLGRTKRQITFDSFYVVVSFLSSTSGSCFTWLKMQNWWKPFRQKQKLTTKIFRWVPPFVVTFSTIESLIVCWRRWGRMGLNLSLHLFFRF